MSDALTDLNATDLLAAATSAVRARRLAEVHDLQVLTQWAVLHATDPTDPTTGPDPTDAAAARRLGDRLVQLGGDGTPGVQDFSLGEIALARGTGITATTHALADALDLQHRLPRTWQVLRTGTAEVYIARRVAKLSRHLPADKVSLVDTAVARVIAHEAGGRTLAVAEAAIIEADPALHDARVEAEKARRYVGYGRTDAHGLRTVIARITAGDAVWVKATLERVTDILTPTHPDTPADELRAIAFGWLARPAELLQLLLQHTEPDHEDTEPDEPDSEPDHEPDSESDGEHDIEHDIEHEIEHDIEHEPEDPGGQSRATAFPADLLDALRGVDLTPLAPKAVLYVHLHEAALTGTDAVARAEGLGPTPLSELAALLGRTTLTVRPVRDLAHRIRSTAYEHPASLKDQTYLRTAGDYWPYATSTSRHLDYDHPTPYQHTPDRPAYDDTGPPDDTDPPDPPRPSRQAQTGSHNSGPLGRRHHRWKTHAGYQSRQCGDGRYVWLTPHGLGFLVDHLGTHPIHPDHARALLHAPPGVDLYLT